MNYPVAEIFHSLQGEGLFTGTPMMFVRLAGCNVGRYAENFNEACSATLGNDFPLVNKRIHSICTTHDGQRFICDTDYHMTEKLSEEEIAARLQGEEHVCITGGEPLMHDLAPLCHQFRLQTVHLETSGTKPLPAYMHNNADFWITCCPKRVPETEFVEQSVILYADEWKLLVGPNFDEEHFKKFSELLTSDNLYLQPINGVDEVWQKNLQHCQKLLTRYPQWKLSVQLHKYLGVR